jgi:hypothetical protein
MRGHFLTHFAATYKIIIEIVICSVILFYSYSKYITIFKCVIKSLISFVSVPQIVPDNKKTYTDVKVTAIRWFKIVYTDFNRHSLKRCNCCLNIHMDCVETHLYLYINLYRKQKNISNNSYNNNDTRSSA